MKNQLSFPMNNCRLQEQFTSFAKSCHTFQDDVKSETEHINLKVTGQDGSVVHFKIKRNTPLRNLMSAYCDRAVSFSGAF